MASKFIAQSVAAGAQPSVTFQELYGELPNRTIYVRGTFDGASAAVQMSPDAPSVPDASSSWVAIVGATFTANGYVDLNSTFEKVRVVVTGGDGGTAIDVIMMAPGS